MVRNPSTGLPGDLLTSAGLPHGKVVRSITEDQARSLLEETGPNTKRRGAFYSGQHRAWYIWVLQYMGFQMQDSMRVLETADPRLLVEDGAYVANYILRMVSANIARKSSAKISWDVVPKTSDQVDQDGAKVGAHLLDWAYEYLDIYPKSLDRNLWMECCGNAFYYADWNPKGGKDRRVYVDPIRKLPIHSNELQPGERQFLDSMNAFVDVRDGDYDFEVLSPFQVIVPQTCTDINKASWVRFDTVMQYDEIWNRWPNKAKDITEDDEWSNYENSYWRRLATLAARTGDMLHAGSDPGDGIVVSQIWIRPSAQIPQGATIIGTKRQLLENGPNKFFAMGLDITHPLIHYRNIRVPGRMWGMGTVEHLVQAQRDYNRGRDQLNRARDINGVAQWLAPKGSLRGPVRNEEGDIWEYDVNSGGKPEIVQAPQVAPAVLESLKMAVTDMQIIAAQSDPTQGVVPAGVRSGVAIRSLQEKDQQVLGPSVNDIERGDARTGRLLLLLAWKNIKIPRAIEVYGQARQADLVWFRGSDLNGNARVTVTPGSMMPKSKAETAETLMNLLQIGALQPAVNPADRRLVFKGLEIGGTDRMFEAEDADRRRARQENMMFSRPRQDDPNFAFPDVDIDDDHVAHQEEHLMFKKTDEFERMPPIRKMAFNAHLEKHKMAMAEMVQAAAAFQQVSAGGGQRGSSPKEPGKASQPRDRNETPGSEKTP